MKMKLFLITVLALLQFASATEKLPSFNVNLAESTVSGLSSGGFFAVQMHVAYSANIQAAAVFAGGPYHCAEGSEVTALTSCMNPFLPLDPETYVNFTKLVSGKTIDDVSNLADDKVFLFSGTVDTTVHPEVMKTLKAYYETIITNGSVVSNFTVEAAHTQPTDLIYNLNSCTTSSSPYISNCNYDGAGVAFQQMYGALKPRNTGNLTGKYIQFDQTEFISGDSMDSTGWAYVPAACAGGAACKLHVSFHGCAQYQDAVGMAYVKDTGYNLWADTNNIIVLYPQTVASYLSPSNPQGCWDWWGYNNAFNYDNKDGVQQKAIFAMMQRVAGGSKSFQDEEPAFTVLE